MTDRELIGMKKDSAEIKILWLLVLSFLFALASVGLMIVALYWRHGRETGPIIMMTGGTINLFMQGFVLWPLSGYYLKTEPVSHRIRGIVKFRHVLFFILCLVTLVASAIGIFF